MTGKEASLFRWMECLTITGGSLAEDSWQARFALDRKYAASSPDGLRLTPAGRDWFGRRAALVTAGCEQGAHQYRPKEAGGTCLHCRWCGKCEQHPCPECSALSVRLVDERVPMPPTHRYRIDANGDYIPVWGESDGIASQGRELSSVPPAEPGLPDVQHMPRMPAEGSGQEPEEVSGGESPPGSGGELRGETVRASGLPELVHPEKETEHLL